MELGGMGEIAGLMFPRPICLIQGKEDPIFPVSGAYKAFDVTKKI